MLITRKKDKSWGYGIQLSFTQRGSKLTTVIGFKVNDAQRIELEIERCEIQ